MRSSHNRCQHPASPLMLSPLMIFAISLLISSSLSAQTTPEAFQHKHALTRFELLIGPASLWNAGLDVPGKEFFVGLNMGAALIHEFDKTFDLALQFMYESKGYAFSADYMDASITPPGPGRVHQTKMFKYATLALTPRVYFYKHDAYFTIGPYASLVSELKMHDKLWRNDSLLLDRGGYLDPSYLVKKMDAGLVVETGFTLPTKSSIAPVVQLRYSHSIMNINQTPLNYRMHSLSLLFGLSVSRRREQSRRSPGD
jgi:hypothetical protein